MARLNIAEDDEDGSVYAYNGDDYNLVAKSEDSFPDPFNVKWEELKSLSLIHI